MRASRMDRVNGIENIQVNIVMMQTSNGYGGWN
jgi:hypothetical protein